MQQIKSIDAKTAANWLKNQEAVIIDVREPFEYQEAHIVEAIHIPLKQLKPSDIEAHKDKKIIMHCRSGMRSMNACQILVSSNDQLDLYNLEGGILAWQQAGLHVNQKKSKSIIPIDRQAQVVTGTGVLLGVILGYFIHPGFLWLSAFFGAGLVFTGLSGSCALATMLAKMPWNK